MMRFYNQPHRFYAGIDLHARTISLCVLDAAGAIVREATLAATPAAVLDTLAPSRKIGVSSFFGARKMN